MHTLNYFLRINFFKCNCLANGNVHSKFCIYRKVSIIHWVIWQGHKTRWVVWFNVIQCKSMFYMYRNSWRAAYENLNSSYLIFTFFFVLKFTINKKSLNVYNRLWSQREQSSKNCFLQWHRWRDQEQEQHTLTFLVLCPSPIYNL